MPNIWTTYVVLSALTISAVGLFIWKKTRKSFIRVGKVSNLYFFPVKSLKGFEVTKGRCTELGFEVNGILDRAFMLVDDDGVLVSQRQEPSLVLLSPEISGKYLIINGPNIEPLRVEIKDSPSSEDKIVNCIIHGESVGGVHCGDEAAHWFQSYLKKENVHLIRFFPNITSRNHLKKDPFYIALRKKYPAGFQDFAAVHIISKSSIEDLNSKIKDQNVSVLNFRPNILVDDCDLYAEDSWKYVKVKNEDGDLELVTLILTTRCLLTTNDPETGILTQKEPLVTLRKYRIAADPEWAKLLGSIPCLGTTCGVLSPGEIAVGDDIFAVVGKQPKMLVKST